MKENALILPADRKQILTRIRTLKKYLVLLSYQYAGSNPPTNSWADRQFKLIKRFVEEKEWQITAPLTDTHSKILGELQSLVEILMTARYGDFKFKSTATASNEEPVMNHLSHIFRGVLKLLGIITPLLLLIGIYFFPEQFRTLGFDNKVVALVCLAWLLLAIDINLNLGIAERVGELVKAFRELR
jgi:hypothetical protein